MSGYSIKVNGAIVPLAPGDHWISTTKGMVAYFAVEYWINDEEPGLGPFREPWDSGFGRYATRALAREEAAAMAAVSGLPLADD